MSKHVTKHPLIVSLENILGFDTVGILRKSGTPIPNIMRLAVENCFAFGSIGNDVEELRYWQREIMEGRYLPKEVYNDL